MKYLIDGYNWFFRKFKEDGHFVKDHTNFVKYIVNNLIESKDVFAIVFDGKGILEFESYGPNIQIIYSGENQSADDCILEFLETKTWKGSVVVTSDIDLSKKATALGAKTFSIDKFLKKRRKRKKQEQYNPFFDEITNNFLIETFQTSLEELESGKKKI